MLLLNDSSYGPRTPADINLPRLLVFCLVPKDRRHKYKTRIIQSILYLKQSQNNNLPLNISFFLMSPGLMVLLECILSLRRIYFINNYHLDVCFA